jgi:pimeloyl-ACP methyl ester carboxylesterase
MCRTLEGFGASDKLPGATYSFKQQLGDLEAVVEALGLVKIVPVAHKSSGPASINFALEHPDRVDSVCMLNSAYADAPTILWPELVALFATKSFKMRSLALLRKVLSNSVGCSIGRSNNSKMFFGCPEGALRGVSKAPSYLCINPMGKVPTIRHGDTVVTEVAAICAYLADAFPRAGLAPPPRDRLRGPYYRWLFFAAGPVEAAVTNKTLGFVVSEGRERMAGLQQLRRCDERTGECRLAERLRGG